MDRIAAHVLHVGGLGKQRIRGHDSQCRSHNRSVLGGYPEFPSILPSLEGLGFPSARRQWQSHEKQQQTNSSNTYNANGLIRLTV